MRLVLFFLFLLTPLLGEEALLLPKADQAIVTTIRGGWAVGERGHLFRVSPSIQQLPFPSQQMLTDIAVEGDRMWITGHDALLYYREGEQEWIQQHYDPEIQAPLMSLQIEGEEGMAVGGFGLTLRTENGGQEWTRIYPSEEDPHFYMVRSDKNKDYYLVGEYGVALKLSPDGAVVARYDTKTSATLFGIEVLEPDSWMAYGLGGVLILHNELETLQIENPRKEHLYGSLRLENALLFCGSDGTLLIYRNGALEDHSRQELISYLSMSIEGKDLLIGTTKGFRRLALEEVLK